MRHFDLRQSYFDLEATPLHGRVCFYKYGTTELENIYDSDGTPMANPVFTDTIGQLNDQVFLKDDTDYTIVFEKYVGNGDFHTDPDGWLFQYSAVDRWLTYHISVESESLQSVNNITDLKNLNPLEVEERDGKRIVAVLGYNEIGDKATVYYEWDSESIDSDNGGSVIKENDISTGRWVLVNTFNSVTGLDVRHFGVFGADSASEAQDTMSYKIQYASDYAQSIHVPLYFGSNGGQLTWYKINNVNLYGCLFAESTRIFGNTGTASQITVMDPDTYLDCFSNQSYKAVFTIAGETVRTSWGVDTINCIYAPTYKLIIDSPVNTNEKDWSNIVVEAMEDITGAQFDGCYLISNGHIGNGCTFKNMRLTELMFKDGVDFDTITVYETDTIDIEDFPTTSIWYALALQNSSRVFDFKGRIVDESCENDTSSPIWYKNAIFSNYIAKQTDIYFVNCSGIVGSTVAVQNVNMKDCDGLTLGGESPTLTTFIADGSKFKFARSMTITTAGMLNSECTDINSVTHYVTTLSAKGSTIKCNLSGADMGFDTCTINGNVTVVNPSIINCEIHGTIYHNAISSPIQFNVTGNRFIEGNGYNLRSIVPNSVVAGSWINNYSSLNFHFIVLDRTNLDPNEQNHTYKYSGNTGPYTLQRDSAKWSDVVFTGPNYSGRDSHGATQNKTLTFTDTDSDLKLIGYAGRQDTSTGLTDPTFKLTEFQIFSVGTQNLGALSLSAKFPQHLTASMQISGSPIVSLPTILQMQASEAPLDDVEKIWGSGSSGALGWPKGYTFKNGYTWYVNFVQGMATLKNSVSFPTDNADWQIPVKYELTLY